jgi:predicted DNA binding CopG/RHH family protein
MAKPKSGSSAQGKRATKNVKTYPKDEDIDYSDIPEQAPEQLKEFRPIGRPLAGLFAKQMIAIRLDPELLKKLKTEAEDHGIGYQTLIQQILSKHFSKKSA